MCAPSWFYLQKNMSTCLLTHQKYCNILTTFHKQTKIFQLFRRCSVESKTSSLRVPRAISKSLSSQTLILWYFVDSLFYFEFCEHNLTLLPLPLFYIRCYLQFQFPTDHHMIFLPSGGIFFSKIAFREFRPWIYYVCEFPTFNSTRI